MDYNKLKTLALIKEYGSITATARALLRSQSAITQQIQSLEDELDLKLLDRKLKKVFLTREAEKLVTAAQQGLDLIDQELAQIKQQMSDVQGTIHLGALQDGGTEFSVGELIASFCEQHPAVRFVIHSGTGETLEQGLLDGQYDFVFSVIFRSKGKLKRLPMKTSLHSLYAAKSYLDQAPALTRYRDLIDHRLIDLNEDFVGIKTFINKNSPNTVVSINHRLPDIVAPNLHTKTELVIAGAGIAMLPDHLVRSELAAGKIIKLFPKAKHLAGTIDLAYRRHQSLGRKELLFRDHCQSWAKRNGPVD